MKTILRIAVQEFALFTVQYFLKAAEFGIKKHENYGLGVFVERTEGLGLKFVRAPP